MAQRLRGMEYHMGIGARLKQARSSKGYTQNSLADAIGVSRGVITNIEHEKAEPQMLVIRGICYELELTARGFFRGKAPWNQKKTRKEVLIFLPRSIIYLPYFQKKNRIMSLI